MLNDAKSKLYQKLLLTRDFFFQEGIQCAMFPDLKMLREKNPYLELLLKGCEPIYMMKLNFNF